MTKRKEKPKRKGLPPGVRLARQISGCLSALAYVVALLFFFVSIMSIGLLIIASFLFPPFNPLVWIVIALLLAYISGYFAFGDDKDDPK